MRSSYLCLAGLFIVACSGNDGNLMNGFGGTTGATSGGSVGTTASSAQGGQTTAVSAGGSSSTNRGGNGTGGASVGSGGTSTSSTTSLNSGGTTSTASATATTGGTKATGGAAPVGGNGPKGGTSSSGGASVTGGSSAKGGSTQAGGASTTAAGAKSSTGGSAAGGSAAGGTTATGGASTAGGAVAVTCKNLSMAPSATGKAKPSGAVGGLKVLDWAGFTGAVSFTFDDANPSQTTSYAQLKATGAHSTFFIITGSGNASNTVWKTAANDGNEIGNHTQSHSSSASLADLQTAEDFIQKTFSVTAYTMAAPNGDTSWSSVAPQLLFLNRGVSNGLIAPRGNSDAFNLPAYIPPTSASSSAMDGEVNAAKTGNGWKIFCIHGFDSANGTYQPVPLANVTTTMSNAVKAGVWAESMMNVGAYWLGQKAIPAASATSATWTLPAHFPPNMCVRVTVTGGTVTQNGAAVPWDDHGYYEISLDAKSVTVQ